MNLPVLSQRGVKVADIELLCAEQGEGQALLFLHPQIGLAGSDAFVTNLATDWRVIIPSHPGFDRSDRPDTMASVDDLAYLYLELIKQLGLRDVVLAGVSLGAWIAMEIAVRATEAIAGLALLSPVGVKFGAPDQVEIADQFIRGQAGFDAIAYSDPALSVAPGPASSADERLHYFKNNEAAAAYAWSPYMHNPRLRRWLYRIDRPVLILRGEDDRVTGGDYAHALAAAMPGTRLENIAEAGHFIHVEKPVQAARAIQRFARSRRADNLG